MKLSNFISKFDKLGSIVLLEGKRNVLKCDKRKLVNLGKKLAAETKKIIFRSGNANGADYHFSKGVGFVDISRLQVITPYADHRIEENIAGETIAIDSIDFVREEEVIYKPK